MTKKSDSVIEEAPADAPVDAPVGVVSEVITEPPVPEAVPGVTTVVTPAVPSQPSKVIVDEAAAGTEPDPLRIKKIVDNADKATDPAVSPAYPAEPSISPQTRAEMQAGADALSKRDFGTPIAQPNQNVVIERDNTKVPGFSIPGKSISR